jgi:hypothetical protein
LEPLNGLYLRQGYGRLILVSDDLWETSIDTPMGDSNMSIKTTARRQYTVALHSTRDPLQIIIKPYDERDE